VFTAFSEVRPTPHDSVRQVASLIRFLQVFLAQLAAYRRAP
jgi:hypothetical protein